MGNTIERHMISSLWSKDKVQPSLMQYSPRISYLHHHKQYIIQWHNKYNYDWSNSPLITNQSYLQPWSQNISLQCLQAPLKINIFFKSNIRKFSMHCCKVRDHSQLSSDNNKRADEQYQAIISSSSMSNFRSCLEIFVLSNITKIW